MQRTALGFLRGTVKWKKEAVTWSHLAMCPCLRAKSGDLALKTAKKNHIVCSCYDRC